MRQESQSWGWCVCMITNRVHVSVFCMAWHGASCFHTSKCWVHWTPLWFWKPLSIVSCLPWDYIWTETGFVGLPNIVFVLLLWTPISPNPSILPLLAINVPVILDMLCIQGRHPTQIWLSSSEMVLLPGSSLQVMLCSLPWAGLPVRPVQISRCATHRIYMNLLLQVSSIEIPPGWSKLWQKRATRMNV